MRRAFTLIEILVVVAIISLLACIFIPSMSMTRARAQASQCQTHLRALGNALSLYLSDHQMIMPSLQMGRSSKNDDVPVIDNTLNTYVDDQRVFSCPADTKNYYQTAGTSYGWNLAVNGQSVAADNLRFLTFSNQTISQIPVIGDMEGWHKYRDSKVNYLYLDGHVDQDLPWQQQ